MEFSSFDTVFTFGFGVLLGHHLSATSRGERFRESAQVLHLTPVEEDDQVIPWQEWLEEHQPSQLGWAGILYFGWQIVLHVGRATCYSRAGPRGVRRHVGAPRARPAALGDVRRG